MSDRKNRHQMPRRAALARLGAAGAGAMLSHALPAVASGSDLTLPLQVAGREVELVITPVSDATVRISLLPIEYGRPVPIEESIVFPRDHWPEPAARMRSVPWWRPGTAPQTVSCGNLRVETVRSDRTLMIVANTTKPVQALTVGLTDGSVLFSHGGKIFGLGEGGPQFDRRGQAYPMKNGERVPDLAVNGARLPIPWLISPEGWALFFNAPLGSFDLSGTLKPGPQFGLFQPCGDESPLPIDIFLVAPESPAAIMKEYAQLTGFPHLPPLWALGYQQSHRTLASREEVLDEAKSFREKKLPCDVLIYLGTGFCPSGWNTGHGSFTFNTSVFPDPGPMIQELAQENFKVVLHVVNPPIGLHGRADDTGSSADDETDAAHYWQKHLPVFRLGVGGWWPDEGDALGPIECLVRSRMYWEGPQIERPAERPYALHRNGYAGLQRYGWLWSGDIDSTWEVLRAQIAVGINTGLSGIPFWGTDTGGFVTTPELTGELYARWFQFSAFCALFRSHGRTWKLRLPWQWNTGEYGPTELNSYHGKAGLPDPKELHNPEIEPICRKYLELRSRLMPYTYSVVRESHDTGLPIMRALWLHYPDDPQAVECGDEYLWGRDILVAPVTEKGARQRQVYLPSGLWRDFWTEKQIEGGRTVSREVDLATLPLYVRAGALLPSGPVRQYAAEIRREPLEFTIYPGADGEFELYEDDGVSFEYERGQFTRLNTQWSERSRHLMVSLVEGSRLSEPRDLSFRVAGESHVKQVGFDGTPLGIQL
jgi:alpha-glucosidase (family GH31 glycosyl hydrolase)